MKQLPPALAVPLIFSFIETYEHFGSFSFFFNVFHFFQLHLIFLFLYHSASPLCSINHKQKIVNETMITKNYEKQVNWICIDKKYWQKLFCHVGQKVSIQEE